MQLWHILCIRTFLASNSLKWPAPMKIPKKLPWFANHNNKLYAVSIINICDSLNSEYTGHLKYLYFFNHQYTTRRSPARANTPYKQVNPLRVRGRSMWKKKIQNAWHSTNCTVTVLHLIVHNEPLRCCTWNVDGEQPSEKKYDAKQEIKRQKNISVLTLNLTTYIYTSYKRCQRNLCTQATRFHVFSFILFG